MRLFTLNLPPCLSLLCLFVAMLTCLSICVCMPFNSVYICLFVSVCLSISKWIIITNVSHLFSTSKLFKMERKKYVCPLWPWRRHKHYLSSRSPSPRPRPPHRSQSLIHPSNIFVIILTHVIARSQFHRRSPPPSRLHPPRILSRHFHCRCLCVRPCLRFHHCHRHPRHLSHTINIRRF